MLWPRGSSLAGWPGFWKEPFLTHADLRTEFVAFWRRRGSVVYLTM